MYDTYGPWLFYDTMCMDQVIDPRMAIYGPI